MSELPKCQAPPAYAKLSTEQWKTHLCPNYGGEGEQVSFRASRTVKPVRFPKKAKLA